MNLQKVLELRKAKYIRRYKDKTGKWQYIYKDINKKKSKIDIKKIGVGIRKAIKENKGRLSHGYTATNAFWILSNGDIKKFKDKNIMNEKNVISVHSHSPENYEKQKKSELQTFSGGDLYGLAHMIKYNYGNTLVVVNAHGIMDVFKGSNKFGKLKKNVLEYEKQLTRENMNKIAEKHKIPIKGQEDKIYRMVLRELAKVTDSEYLEKVNWK